MKEINRIRKRRDNVKYYNGNFDELFVNGIYDEGNYNNRGKFGKGEKLYWNKVSGKWVRKKGECFISKKIGVYEFENLNERNIVELFKKGDVYGFRYIDRVEYFIKVLYLKYKFNGKLKDGEILNNEGWVYINQRDIISYLGSDWGKLLSRLKSLKYIDYKRVGKSKYRNRDIINLRLIGSSLGEVKNKRFIENKILEKNIIKSFSKNGFDLKEIEFVSKCKLEISEKRLDKICEEKYIKKYNQFVKELNWGNMFFNEKNLNDRRRFIEEEDKEGYYKKIKNRYLVYKDVFDEMNNGFINYDLFKVDNFGGRFYNIINGLDKEFRRELKYNGEELVEIDFSGMYVKCLVYMFERLKIINTKGFKKRKKNKFLELKRKGYLDIKESWKKRNKELYGFEWDDGEIIDFELGKYKGISYNEDIWNNRRYYFEKKFGEVDYDLGNNKGYSLNKIIESLNNEEEWMSFLNEYNNVLREFGENEEGDDYIKSFGVNYNVLNFRRVDNLLNNIIGYFSEMKKEVYRNLFFDNELVGVNIRDYKNYGEYLEDGNEKIKVESVFSWEDDIELDEDYFKIGFKKGDKVKYKVLDYKFNKKIRGNEKYREKYFDEFLRKVGSNWFGDYIDYDWEFEKWLLEKYGKDKVIEFEEDIEFDFSEDEKYGYNGFIELYKNNVLSNKKLDFYDYLKWKLNYNKVGRKLGRKGFSEKEIFDRDFYKVLIMRILFTQNYMIEKLRMNDIELGVRDLVKEIFGEEGKMYLEKIKGLWFKYDEYGNKRKVDFDYSENYKNISKILSVIEVDIMNYLKRRVFWINGLMRDEFYINVFDGFMVRKSMRNKIKCELNMVLENEVGYMFYMK